MGHPSNQIDRVICRIRFNTLLDIDRRMDEFRYLVGERYSGYSTSDNIPLNMTDMPLPVNHVLQSVDGSSYINLSVSGLGLTVTRYTCWDDFRQEFSGLMEDIQSLFDIGECLRIGLRYINAVRPSSVDIPSIEGILRSPYSDLFRTSIGEVKSINSTIDRSFDGGMRGRSIIDTIQFSDGEVGILIDDDVFIEGDIPFPDVMDVLDRINSTSSDLFRSIASDALLEKVL